MSFTARAIVSVAVLAAGGCSMRHVEMDRGYEGDAWPSTRATYWIDRSAVALVPNSVSDTLSLLDLSAGVVVATVPIGIDPVGRNGPHFAAFDRDAKYAYVTLQFPPPLAAGPHAAHGSSAIPGALLKIRTSDLSVESVLRLRTNPADFAFTPDGARLVVAHFDLARANDAAAAGKSAEEMRATVAIVDVATMRIVAAPTTCIAPHGVAVSADGARAFVACYGEDAIGVIGLAGDYPVARWPLAATLATPATMSLGPMVAVLGPDPRVLVVSETEGKEVRILDTRDGATIATVGVRGAPFLPASNADGSEWVVPVQAPDRLLVLSATTWTVSGQIALDPAVCSRPHMVARRLDRWFVVCEGDHEGPGSVVELDAEWSVVRAMATGIWPNMMATGTP